VWDLPDGVVQVQHVLQYPVCLIVIAPDYARLYGVVTGRSEVRLEGRGWAAGVMLQPATGRLLWGESVGTITDRHVPLESVSAIDAVELTENVRLHMNHEPTDDSRRRKAVEIYESALAFLSPVDEEGRTVNELVALVEMDASIERVEQLADRLSMSERTLQRMTRERLGLTPKWLIQRRRLHDAVDSLKTGEVDLARLSISLGYADQAHFTRDFRRVTGMTPGTYLGEQR
jgi:AraC-like DNA-binding protein